MFGINPFELLIILMVGLIVVGPKRLPEIGRTIGRAFSEIRRVQDEIRDTVRFDLEDDDDEGPPSYPARSERVPEEPPGPTAVELASAAARDRDGPRDAISDEDVARSAPSSPAVPADLDEPAADRDGPTGEAPERGDEPGVDLDAAADALLEPSQDPAEPPPRELGDSGELDPAAPGPNGSVQRATRDEAE